jgi:hypothetical protein
VPLGPLSLGALAHSSAAAAATKGWATVTALLRITAGRPVAIGTRGSMEAAPGVNTRGRPPPRLRRPSGEPPPSRGGPLDQHRPGQGRRPAHQLRGQHGLRIATAVVLVGYRRCRHLVVFAWSRCGASHIMICASGRWAIHRCSTGRCTSCSTRVG